MDPQIFTVEFEQQLIITLVTLLLGGGGAVAVWLGRRRSKSEAGKDLSESWKSLVQQQVESLVKPLQEQVERDQEQISHLEAQQNKLFAAAKYNRELGHWLADTCGFFPRDWLKTHPKPHLPDILRDDFGELK
jgi:hypothetical protein